MTIHVNKALYQYIIDFAKDNWDLRILLLNKKIITNPRYIGYFNWAKIGGKITPDYHDTTLQQLESLSLNQEDKMPFKIIHIRREASRDGLADIQLIDGKFVIEFIEKEDDYTSESVIAFCNKLNELLLERSLILSSEIETNQLYKSPETKHHPRAAIITILPETPPSTLISLIDVKDVKDEEFKNELAQLKETLNTITDDKIKAKANEVIAQIKLLKREVSVQGLMSTETLINAVKNTNALLKQKMNAEEYNNFAKKVRGNPSMGIKILGALLIALGALVAIAGIVCAATGVGIVPGIGAAVVGTGSVLLGASLFRPKELAKAMNDLESSTSEVLRNPKNN